ncbi:hypothetical protein PybrP1_004857 [[Pythium] brassicae (nom. inval.)]|nr:hypothetical protein PybrP1_004857 [[Pythium] brassicae (nom. inval.)]
MKLLEFLSPGIARHLPSRRVLGGRLLVDEANRWDAEDQQPLRDVQMSSGGRVNLLSDVWQNVSKDHLMGAQLPLYGCLVTFDLVEVGDRYDGLAIAEILEAMIVRAREASWAVGVLNCQANSRTTPPPTFSPFSTMNPIAPAPDARAVPAPPAAQDASATAAPGGSSDANAALEAVPTVAATRASPAATRA